MKNLKKLTILHSNDMHGDFLAENVNDVLTGGVSRLSGYIQKVRREEKNVIYAIAGDMFRGSLIDTEYKGLSTVEMVNMLGPDVVTLGNHETDYGLAHLLFIEKCARFPIINANLYITMNQKRLFNSHIIKEIDGMKILFIGVLTEEVLNATRRDTVIGSIVDVAEAAQEVGKICNAYKTEDIDFTVILSHIGIEADKELARALDPQWGVDVIIGGHSHTYLEKPVEIAGIPIVQAACGTDQIGRFDIMIDTDNNCIDSYSWQLIPINEKNCPRDMVLEQVLARYKGETDKKYLTVISRMADCYTHPVRNRSTALGMLLADIFKESLKVDMMLLGSGAIRREYMGPVVTKQDILEVMPYKEAVSRLVVTGAQIKHMVEFSLRFQPGSRSEDYQYSKGMKVKYDTVNHKLVSFLFEGKEIQDEDVYTLGLQDFHICNIKKFLDVTLEELSGIKKPKLICTNTSDVLEEYFLTHEHIKAPEEERLTLIM